MAADIRRKWEYKGCTISPIANQPSHNAAKVGEPIDFGFGPRNRYWRIDFPNGTHCHVETKTGCQTYIDRVIEENTPDVIVFPSG